MSILRNFVYLDQQAVDDYLSVIEGALYDETIVESSNRQNSGSLSAGISGLAGGKGERATEKSVQSTKIVNMTYPSKLQRIFNYLEEKKELSYFDFVDEETWKTVKRNKIIECEVSIRLSKITSLIESLNTLVPLINVVQDVSGQNILGKDSEEMIAGFSALGLQQKDKKLPCELKFQTNTDNKFISYLNPEYIVGDKTLLENEYTILCKIQRLLRNNENIDIANIIPNLENFGLNREQKRAMKNEGTKIPEEIQDIISAPGALIHIIAIYN